MDINKLVKTMEAERDRALAQAAQIDAAIVALKPLPYTGKPRGAAAWSDETKARMRARRWPQTLQASSTTETIAQVG